MREAVLQNRDYHGERKDDTFTQNEILLESIGVEKNTGQIYFLDAPKSVITYEMKDRGLALGVASSDIAVSFQDGSKTEPYF